VWGEEARTAKKVIQKLPEIGVEVQQVGGGVVGIIRNGDGRRDLFHADVDAPASCSVPAR
jgi:hippurate hydrolase